MLQLKTILKWLLPSVKFTCKMLAVSGEVFCRHSFGQRYLATLLVSFIFSFVILLLQRATALVNQPTTVDIYLLTYFILILYHACQMWRPHTAVHSYSNGQSWGFWERLPIKPVIVRIIIEPAVLIVAGRLLRPANDFLSAWIQAAGLCLSGKEIIAYWHHGNRVLDALDARLEGERVGTDVRQHSTPRAGGEQRVNPAVTVEPGQPTADSIQQIYSRIDPALQRLIGATNQDRPNTAPLVRVVNRRITQRKPANPPGAVRRINTRRPQ